MTEPGLKRKLTELLEQHVDPELGRYGFRRRRGGLTHSRRTREGTQRIVVGLDCGVPWAPDGCTAQVVANFNIKIPGLSGTLASLIDPGMVWQVDPAVILSLPVELISGQKPMPTWYLCGTDADGATIEDLGRYLRNHVVPFADRYSTVRGLLDAYDAGDRVPDLHETWWLRIVAAFLHVGDRERAMQAMSAHLGSALDRKLYAETWRRLAAY